MPCLQIADLLSDPGRLAGCHSRFHRAALIYQHEARGADNAITEAIDDQIGAAQDDDSDDDDGTAGVLVPAR